MSQLMHPTSADQPSAPRPDAGANQSSLRSAAWSSSQNPAETGASRTSPWSRPVTAAVLVVWGLGVAAGIACSIQYEATPGATKIATERWPESRLCTLSRHIPTLVMFVHPRCPCSRASLSELAVLMTHCPGRVDAQVVFLRAALSPPDWARTDLWQSAARIPGVRCLIDDAGAEQCRFGARVSGETFVYRSNGELAFHGGITSGRGHMGDNYGRSAVEALLHGRPLPIDATPVFGCELEPPQTISQDHSDAGQKSTGR